MDRRQQRDDDRPQCLDGNEAAAQVAYRLSEVIALYPITPATPMGEWADRWQAQGRPNLWGTPPRVIEMQSEAGAAGALHGALQAGALASSFTASQGLLLMLPTLYRLAGELAPLVLHVATRALAAQALSIFGDHGDVMAVRTSGCAILVAASVQEAGDFAAIASRSSLLGRTPFLHAFDGFRTSHEIQKIRPLSDGVLRALIPPAAIAAHRRRGLTPERPVLRGTAQNPDVYFQGRETVNPFIEALPAVVQQAMDRFAGLTGRRYGLFECVGPPDAERVLVLMGSACETVEETLAVLNRGGARVAVLKVRLFRPFAAARFVAALPPSTRAVAVLDRCKEAGAVGEPLLLEVLAALQEHWPSQPPGRPLPQVVGGRYGLGSREFTPAMVRAVVDHLAASLDPDLPPPRRRFTVGIVDDVSHLSLPVDESFVLEGEALGGDGTPGPGMAQASPPQTEVRAIVYGLGADGSVGACKSTVQLVGERSDRHVQAYVIYDSKKAGSVTISHLRFAARPIRAPYLIQRPTLVACHQWDFVGRYPLVDNLVPGGTLLLNSPFDAAGSWRRMPQALRSGIRRRRLRVWLLNADRIARELGLGPHINTVMQVGFFAVSDLLPHDEAIAAMREGIRRSYGRKGEAVVALNLRALEASRDQLLPLSWEELADPDPAADGGSAALRQPPRPAPTAQPAAADAHQAAAAPTAAPQPTPAPTTASTALRPAPADRPTTMSTVTAKSTGTTMSTGTTKSPGTSKSPGAGTSKSTSKSTVTSTGTGAATTTSPVPATGSSEQPERQADEPACAAAADAPPFVREVTLPLLALQGERLPVSALPCDGTWPTGTSRYEKRNIATTVPVWDADLCVQCGKCVLVCPHAVIRAKVAPPTALTEAPEGFRRAPARDPGFAGQAFTIQVAVEDCTGCSLCVEVCPARDRREPRRKALEMVPQRPLREQGRLHWDFFLALPDADPTSLDRRRINHQQLLRPLFEFPGACAGCGETPYLKLASQLFGDRMLVANATGCSSIYGGNLPTTPWTTDAQGRGPAWINALFEDNAEVGLGLRLALDQQRLQAEALLRDPQLRQQGRDALPAALVAAILSADQSDEAGIAEQRRRLEGLRQLLAARPEAADPASAAARLLALSGSLERRSVWLVGGDGWAYDIGFGGLDHVLAGGADVTVLVLDTEVYSNTGGQMSKATPLAAVAKFASGGKESAKKDLGLMAMTYGTVYVASVAMGARDEHTIRAFLEAESYAGPSLILAYSHCIAHGIDMAHGMAQQKLAVETGSWPLYRYDPRRRERGQNPLQLDSGPPKRDLSDLWASEQRFRLLQGAPDGHRRELQRRALADRDRRLALLRALGQGAG